MKYDVVVVGGGFAGVGAAVTAARRGASVLLVEKGNALGGAAVNGLVNPFMVNGTKVNGVYTELSQGLFLEIRSALTAMANKYHSNRKHTGINTFSEEFLKLILNRMAADSHVELLFHTSLVDAQVKNGTLESIRVVNKSGISKIEGSVFIDATGDMDLGVACGCAYIRGRPSDRLCQPMTLCFRLGNVDIEKYVENRKTINEKYAALKNQGKIKNPREDVLIFHTIIDGVLHFNSTRVIRKNPVDAIDLTAAELEAREQVFEMYDFLRENIDGFQNASLLSTAAEIGVRESRMLVGEYVLTQEDLISCKKFEDTIAVGNYDIDIHNPAGSDTSHYYFPEGQYYSIPYRTLLPLELDNLLVSGRCISATHEAQASIRILPIVCNLGEAAGLAAALAAEERTTVKSLDPQRLRREIIKNKGICD